MDIVIKDEEGKELKVRTTIINEDKLEIIVDCKCLKCPLHKGCINNE